MTVSASLDERFRAAATEAGLLDVAFDVLDDTPIGPLLVGVTDRGVCRISFDVGVSSRKDCGLSAATSLMPRACSLAKPTSCTMRSRAKRLAVSTMMVRAPLLAM